MLDRHGEHSLLYNAVLVHGGLLDLRVYKQYYMKSRDSHCSLGLSHNGIFHPPSATLNITLALAKAASPVHGERTLATVALLGFVAKAASPAHRELTLVIVALLGFVADVSESWAIMGGVRAGDMLMVLELEFRLSIWTSFTLLRPSEHSAP